MRDPRVSYICNFDAKSSSLRRFRMTVIVFLMLKSMDSKKNTVISNLCERSAISSLSPLVNTTKRSLVAALCRDDRFGWALWGWQVWLGSVVGMTGLALVCEDDRFGLGLWGWPVWLGSVGMTGLAWLYRDDRFGWTLSGWPVWLYSAGTAFTIKLVKIRWSNISINLLFYPR